MAARSFSTITYSAFLPRLSLGCVGNEFSAVRFKLHFKHFAAQLVPSNFPFEQSFLDGQPFEFAEVAYELFAS